MRRRLYCCCCGDYAGRWKQHWNRPVGYGMCSQCITTLRAKGVPEVEIADLYGLEGINWGPALTD
jgi:hypothetical protein